MDFHIKIRGRSTEQWIKIAIRTILLSPFILGLPIGIRACFFNYPTKDLSLFNEIVIVPGVILCMGGTFIGIILICTLVAHAIELFFKWVFS